MWVQWGDIQILGKIIGGNPSVDRHLSLGVEDAIGQGSPLVENNLNIL
jgi:hypothetical protein